MNKKQIIVACRDKVGLKIKSFIEVGFVGYSRILLLFVLLISVIVLYIWLLQKKYITLADLLTFSAILVALFNQRIQNFIDEPLITVKFDKKSDRCYRTATSEDNILEFGRFNLERQYFRLKISNKGFGTAKQVRAVVELFNKDKGEEERFEPNCLRWITGERDIDIAGGETTYVNLLSHVTKILPPRDKEQFSDYFFVIKLELFDLIHLRGLAWDKDKETYYIKIIIHCDNLRAKTYWFKYIPDEKEMFKAGELLQI